LIFVHKEELRLAAKWNFKMHKVGDFLCYVVEKYDFLFFGKIQAVVVLLSRLEHFKLNLHRYLIESRYFPQNNPLVQLKPLFLLLEDKQLIRKLLIHNKIFATNYSQDLLIVG